MDQNAQTFLKLYNELDALLQKRYNDFDRTHSNIMRYANELSKSPYFKISERGRKLNLIRQIRNLMIHDLDMNNDELISISDELLNVLSLEIKVLSNPQIAIRFCTPISKLLKIKMDDIVSKAFAKMVDAGFTQAPILDDNNRLIGVLSPNAALVYIGRAESFPDEIRIRDLIDYLPIDKHICEHYAFVRKDADADEVAEIFQTYSRNGKKLAMVFVTEHGKETEGVLGILTAFDIVHLM